MDCPNNKQPGYLEDTTFSSEYTLHGGKRNWK